jgi:phosphatidylinositol alpha-1,6-mannosyltransferase
VKVLFLTDSLSDLDGVGRYTMRLVAALEEELPGLEVDILLARRHRPTSSQVPDHWRVSVALPADYFFHMSPARFWPSLALGAFRVWRHARDADLVHAIKDYPHNLVGYLGARLAGVPCVATGHGTYTVQPLLSARHRRLARWVYGRFAALISVSHYTRRRVLEVLAGDGANVLPPERIHVVPNCVEVDYYERRRDTGAKPWSNVSFTLSIGEVKERKGHHLALEAWCRTAPAHPDLHHFVVGKLTEGAYLAALRARVAAAGLEERVHFLGNIDEEEKIELLQRARVFVHTPVTAADGGFEGFGIVYLEASACGAPCIGTLDCGAEDAIVDGETGLLVAQDVDAVARALERLLADEGLCAAMGDAGRRHAASQTWASNAERVADIYAEALR